MEIFDIIGPVMVGPSSSHTAGAVRIGYVAGLLGMRPDDYRISESFNIAKEKNIKITFGEARLVDAHPNSVGLVLHGVNGASIDIVAQSIGGGKINIAQIDGIDTNFSGEYPTLIVHNLDQPGHVSEVTSMLSHKLVNIATMQLYRSFRGGRAVMVVEYDQKIPDDGLKWLTKIEGVLKVTYFDVPKDKLIRALYVAAGIGKVIGENASISGAYGGCQAEIGTASAMASGALVYLQGGDNEAIANAAAFSLKNMLGLTCDPVGGLVEVPCIKRNSHGAVNAAASAQLALAGIKSAISPDDVIDSMRRIGNEMPADVKETGKGGLAVTESAKKMLVK